MPAAMASERGEMAKAMEWNGGGGEMGQTEEGASRIDSRMVPVEAVEAATVAKSSGKKGNGMAEGRRRGGGEEEEGGTFGAVNEGAQKDEWEKVLKRP
jgi:hypothetical protein